MEWDILFLGKFALNGVLSVMHLSLVLGRPNPIESFSSKLSWFSLKFSVDSFQGLSYKEDFIPKSVLKKIPKELTVTNQSIQLLMATLPLPNTWDQWSGGFKLRTADFLGVSLLSRFKSYETSSINSNSSSSAQALRVLTVLELERFLWSFSQTFYKRVNERCCHLFIGFG